MRISEPGIYDLTMEQYLGDCCAGPSMRSGDAITIMGRCAKKAWWDSYLNPERDEENKREFDIGKALHLAVLEPHRFVDNGGIALIRIQNKEGDLVDTYQTKAAQQARDEAYAVGMTPLLPPQHDIIIKMRDALMAHPIARALLDGEGLNERTAIARDPKTGLWMKARPDRLTEWRGPPIKIDGSDLIIRPGDKIALDIKTTTDASEDKFQRRLGDLAYYQQSAWYDETLALISRDVQHFLFATIEVKAPNLPQVFAIDPHAVEWGHLQNRAARSRWAACLKAGDWPGYGDGVRLLKLPSNLEFKLEEKLERAKDEGRFDDFMPANPMDDPLADLLDGRGRFDLGG